MRSLKSDRCLLFVTTLLLSIIALGCEQEIKVPPPPIAPSAAEWARDFRDPQGELSFERQEALIEWMLGPGGIGALAGLVIGEVLLGQWLEPLAEEGGEESKQGQTGGLSAIEGLKVDGWAKLTLPCPSGELSFNLLLTEEGINPVIWGELKQCRYPEFDFAMDGMITLFIPHFSSLFGSGGWSADEPSGLWLWIDGAVEFKDLSAEVSTALELSTEEAQVRTIYEAGRDRFLISFEGIEGLDDLESSLMTLSLLVETGSSSWRCSVESQGCEETE